MLTDNQSAVLAFVVAYREENQRPPTRTEIASKFGWASPNAANDVLIALHRKGYIDLKNGISRGIFVLKEAS